MSPHTSYSPFHDISAWRDQFRLTHTFHLSTGTTEPIAGQLESTLESSKARIEKWVILRRRGCYVHRITVEGIGDESARQLRKELANLDGEIKVHVEHVLHFERAATHR